MLLAEDVATVPPTARSRWFRTRWTARRTGSGLLEYTTRVAVMLPALLLTPTAAAYSPLASAPAVPFRARSLVVAETVTLTTTDAFVFLLSRVSVNPLVERFDTCPTATAGWVRASRPDAANALETPVSSRVPARTPEATRLKRM